MRISNTDAPEGSRIYLRKKSVRASQDIEFSLASKEIEIIGANGVIYPKAATAKSLTTLVTTVGICNEDNTAGQLSFTLFSPTKTTVSSIEFKDQYGNSKGTATVKSTVASNSSAKNSSENYIITTKITNTGALNNATEKELFGTITFANGDRKSVV